MRKFVIPMLLAGLMLTAAFVMVEVARGQGFGPRVIKHETQGENVREVNAPAQGDGPQQPAISFIDSPTATCYQPDPAVDACYLNWYYLSVSASPNYMITMTVTLNAFGPVAHMQGFFQTSMYAPYNMFGRGFKVACGAPGAGGDPQLGNAYAYTIRARDSAGLGAANYGTTYCPSYTP